MSYKIVSKYIKDLSFEIFSAKSYFLLEKNIKKHRPTKERQSNKFFDEKLDGLKNKLEQRTGYQFQLKTNPKGAGTISIKFSNEAEFNDIFEYLVKR